MFRIISRTGWITLSLFFLATTSLSQSATPSRSPLSPEVRKESAKPTPSPDVEILYTGRLLGYFRAPSVQSPTLRSCPAIEAEGSEAAKKFLEQRTKHPHAILLGAGDNFAPQLEARVFTPAPKDAGSAKQEYRPANKELYNYDRKNNKWVLYSGTPDEVQKELEAGLGTIPIDNVGCFLAAAGYAAVVPGKHDFYFGVERVRYLARFMAGLGNTPPQMLGANLVVKTVPLNPGDPQPNKGKPAWLDDWPEKHPVLNVPPSVYPWLSHVLIKITEIDSGEAPDQAGELLFDLRAKISQEGFITEPDLTAFLKERIDQKKHGLDEALKLQEVINEFRDDKFYMCRSKGSPNELEKPGDELKKPGEGCDWLKTREVRLSGNMLVYDVPIERLIKPDEKTRETKYAMTLRRGNNYGFCLLKQEEEEEESKKNKKEEKGGKQEKIPCHRFSVYTPFFFYPNDAPSKPAKVAKENLDILKYTDPDPFVFLRNNPALGRQQDVVIFGVLDPDVSQHVGVLNFAWANKNDELKTSLSVQDPAQALQEQVDYFERWYRENYGTFKGLKILLAQMSPQRARLFAARVPGFQVIVTAVNKEQATSQLEQSITWTSKNRGSGFVAVPAPYFDAQQKKGFVNPGVVEARADENSWHLKSAGSPYDEVTEKESEEAKKNLEQDPNKIKMAEFSKKVKDALKTCVLDGFPKAADTLAAQLNLLTLCAMQKRTNADVVLLQKRDFFDLPKKLNEDFIQVQPYLDRLIWKGDLLTLMYVPGSAIKDALKRSEAFEEEEESVLTLVDERGRSFEKSGIRYDSDHDEYLINEVVIDDNKMYTVATSDFIGAGDTGYPELAKAALNARTHPNQFPKKFDSISSIVCREIFSHGKTSDFCLSPIIRGEYLDQSIAMPVPSYQQPSFGSKFLKLLPFNKPHKLKPAEATDEALQQRVEGRPIWTFSLRNLSLAVTSLTNNLSDDEISQKFGGIPASGIEAKRNRDLVFGLDTRITRSAHSHEYFLASGMDYHETITGNSPLNQVANLLTFDAGIIWRWPGRSIPHLAPVFSLHTETQLKQPVSTFDLGTKDSLTISQDRRWLLLPRLGLRWQNRESTFELGAQAGRAINALAGYRFDTGGVITECLLDSATTLADCITANSTSPNIRITKDSIATPILQNRPRAGIYWNGSFAIKFHSKVKYEFEDKGDFFFNFHDDNVTDTRIRDLSKHRLSFSIWPSFSIGPALHLLLYRNKINNDFLSQKTFTIETKLSFDIFNRREKGVQLKHKP